MVKWGPCHPLVRILLGDESPRPKLLRERAHAQFTRQYIL